MGVARKDLASKCIPRYDDAKDKLGAIVTAPTLFQRLAKHFQADLFAGTAARCYRLNGLV